MNQLKNQNQAANVVHGAPLHYDLPNLAATLGNTITIDQPVNAVGGVIEPSGGFCMGGN